MSPVPALPIPALPIPALAIAAVTDPGLRRPVNEDSLLAESPVFLVADGMGGHEAGDRASAAVVAAFRSRVTGRDWADPAEVREALLAAAAAVDVLAAETERGAGSTVTGLVLIEHEGTPHWLVFNVGDSRVYRQMGSEFTQITTDHSLGQELIERGELRREDLATFPSRNVITRAIGAPDSMADSWLMPVVTGERILVCSDGLHSEVDDEGIRAGLSMNGPPASAASALLERAKAHGGRDNITLIVLDVLAGGRAAGAPGPGDVAAGALDDGADTVPV